MSFVSAQVVHIVVFIIVVDTILNVVDRHICVLIHPVGVGVFV